MDTLAFDSYFYMQSCEKESTSSFHCKILLWEQTALDELVIFSCHKEETKSGSSSKVSSFMKAPTVEHSGAPPCKLLCVLKFSRVQCEATCLGSWRLAKSGWRNRTVIPKRSSKSTGECLKRRRINGSKSRPDWNGVLCTNGGPQTSILPQQRERLITRYRKTVFLQATAAEDGSTTDRLTHRICILIITRCHFSRVVLHLGLYPFCYVLLHKTWKRRVEEYFLLRVTVLCPFHLNPQKEIRFALFWSKVPMHSNKKKNRKKKKMGINGVCSPGEYS